MRIERAVSENLDEIVSVLDEVTLKLLDKGIHQWKYPWYKKDVEKELEYQYVVKKQNKIIALFSIKPLGKNSFIAEAGEKDFYLYRIAVLPGLEQRLIEKEILRFVKRLCRSEKINIYFECDYENEKQRQFYKKEGFYELGNFLEQEYVTVYRFLRKDTPAKNRYKNITKKRKRELRIARRGLLAVFLLFLLINVRTIIKLFDNGIHMTPAVMIGEFTYWRNEGADELLLPKDVLDAGKINKIVRKDRWPDQPMEAVGIPKGMAGEKVYLSSGLDMAYVYYSRQRKYLAFQKELTIINNNYKNGFYEMLLKNCAPEKTVPLDKIPSDATFEQVKKDKPAIWYDHSFQLQIEGEEYFKAFLKSTETEGKAYIRIVQTAGIDMKSYHCIDLFYYKKNYYYFVSNNPDLNNTRFSWLKTVSIPYDEKNAYTVYYLCQNDEGVGSDYFTGEDQNKSGRLLVVFIIPGEEKTSE